VKNTMPVDEYKKLYASNKPKGAKYRNKPTQRIVGDRVISFHSLKEAARYDELVLMLKAGEIDDLRLQPQFTLQESYITTDGERVQAIRYTADFCYLKRRMIDAGIALCLLEEPPEYEYVFVVEDVKSKPTRTTEYRMKKKMMMEKYGIMVREV